MASKQGRLTKEYMKLKEERIKAIQLQDELPASASWDEQIKVQHDARRAIDLLIGFTVAVRLIDTKEAKAIVEDYDDMMGFNKWEKQSDKEV